MSKTKVKTLGQRKKELFPNTSGKRADAKILETAINIPEMMLNTIIFFIT